MIEGAGDALGCFVGIQTQLAIRRFYSASVEFSEALSRLNKCGFELSAFVPNNVGHFPVLIEIIPYCIAAMQYPREPWSMTIPLRGGRRFAWKATVLVASVDQSA